MTNELQQNRYDQTVRRVGNIIGPGSKVNETLNELFPVLDVERIPGELMILGNTDLGMAGTTLPASVASVGKIQLFNPANSGKIVTISGIHASVGTSDLITMGTTGTLFAAGPGLELFRDTRRGLLSSRTTAEFRTLLDPTAGPNFLSFQQAALFDLKLDNENGIAILAPGTGFTVGTLTVNVAISANFFWRERAAEPSELNL